MPNIEIHGNDFLFNARIAARIRELLRDMENPHDVIVSTVGDSVTDLQGEPKPFLRLIFAKNDPVAIFNDCKVRLATLNMDMEVIVIHEFIPKEE